MMNSLIVYFSRSGNNYVSGRIVDLSIGNTKVVAQMIQKHTGADVVELEVTKPYAKAYDACTQEAKRELEQQLRPTLRNKEVSMASYDTIFLGYPNWWGTCPMSIFSFLDQYQTQQLRILPFCTHEGSGLGVSVQALKRAYPNFLVEDGLAIFGSQVGQAEEAVCAWLNKEGLR